METLFSTTEAAESLGISGSRVRQLLLASHQLDENPVGSEVAGVWILTQDDLSRLRSRRDMRRKENRH